MMLGNAGNMLCEFHSNNITVNLVAWDCQKALCIAILPYTVINLHHAVPVSFWQIKLMKWLLVSGA